MDGRKKGKKSGILTLRLAFAFAGGFLGAGFVSGRELWQFFGSFGIWGLSGVLLTGVLFGAVGGLIMKIGLELGETRIDRIVLRSRNRCLNRGLEILQGVFLFAVATIMLAAGAALLEQLCHIPLWAGGLMLAAVVMGIGGSGLKGLIAFFSRLVPLILLFSVATALLAISRFGLPEAFTPAREDGNPLLSSWYLSAFTYASYNVLGTMGLQASLIGEGRDRRQLFRAVALGVLFLMLMAFCMLFALSVQPDVAKSELPMLELACRLHPVFGTLFGFVLLGGMLGACLTGLVLLTDLLSYRLGVGKPGGRRGILAALGALCFLGSFLGFSSLVGVVYPVFGYAGFLVMGFLVEHGGWIIGRGGKPGNK